MYESIKLSVFHILLHTDSVLHTESPKSLYWVFQVPVRRVATMVEVDMEVLEELEALCCLQQLCRLQIQKHLENP